MNAQQIEGLWETKSLWKDPKTAIGLLLFFGITGTSIVTCGRDGAGYVVQPTIDRSVKASEARTNAHCDSNVKMLGDSAFARFDRLESLILTVPEVKKAAELERKRKQAKLAIFGTELKAENKE